MQEERQDPIPLRADAQRNREQIIQAARAEFLRVGMDVPMDEIARAAGVGIATLYRRFPDRGELIRAVSLDNMHRVAALARRLERDEPDPATALRGLVRSVHDVYMTIVMTAVSTHAREALKDTPEIEEQRVEVLTVLSRLLHRAQEQGAIRPDIGPGDLILVLAATSRLMPITDDNLGGTVFERLFALMMDAFRPAPASPLPGRPVEYTDVEQLRQAGGLALFGRTRS